MSSADTVPTAADNLCFGEITVQVTSKTGSVKIDDSVMKTLETLSGWLQEQVSEAIATDDDADHNKQMTGMTVTFILGDQTIGDEQIDVWREDYNVTHADEIADEQAARIAKYQQVADEFWDYRSSWNPEVNPDPPPSTGR